MEQPKIIISVGRQIGSGGRVIAKMLADEFGAKFYNKSILNLAAKESGFSEKFFELNDEKKGFQKSLFNMNIPFFGENNFYDNKFSQEGLYRFQCDAIRKAADSGSCVFVGRTADYVLRERKDMVSVFITADMDDRIKRIARRKDMDMESARKYIIDGENSRASYYNYYTGKKWGHSSAYDLCVNSSLLGIEGTAACIASFIRKTFDKKVTHIKSECD